MNKYSYREAEDLAENVVTMTDIHAETLVANDKAGMMAALVDVGYIRCMIACDWPVADELFSDVVDSMQEYLERFI